ncbi:MAG TPA: cytochrome C oxidase subunit I, partial [Methylomirabilota bacterium]|nr:cytochrome C oxidase subunit I [Methylomirabilota bacterium]
MSTMVEALAGRAFRSRTCGVTGLRVEWHAETLIKVNAVVAVVNFLVGIVAAFGIVMTRWQAVHLLPADLFYRFLTLHGLNMLIFFIIFFEMAVLYFAGPVLLNCRLPMPRAG